MAIVLTRSSLQEAEGPNRNHPLVVGRGTASPPPFVLDGLML